MLLSEEEMGSGVCAICEALLHPVVRHRNTASRITAILDFIRFTPFDYILPDENCSDKGAFHHTAKTQFSEMCELRLLLDRFSLER